MVNICGGSGVLFGAFPFFFNDPATTEIYTLSLHDALPIWVLQRRLPRAAGDANNRVILEALPQRLLTGPHPSGERRSEEHMSELHSRLHLVCRLLLEKKNNANRSPPHSDDDYAA